MTIKFIYESDVVETDKGGTFGKAKAEDHEGTSVTSRISGAICVFDL